MANTFSNLSFDELVEKADEGMRGNGSMVEASRRIARSTNRLAIVVIIFTMLILIVNVLMVVPEMAENLRGFMGMPRLFKPPI